MSTSFLSLPPKELLASRGDVRASEVVGGPGQSPEAERGMKGI
jgi:hypothetical protein